MARWLPIFEVHQPPPSLAVEQVQEYMVPAEPRRSPAPCPASPGPDPQATVAAVRASARRCARPCRAYHALITAAAVASSIRAPVVLALEVGGMYAGRA
ncbi:MAG TPA: hypothetical protein VGH76_10700 [Actinomycetospora sp.]|jgi:hypothetical protein|uniref:hypothetical protein n=1 Tax=Actinomycetospora sp. TaxID=1872135 RepID=UPI002F42D7F5